MVSAVYCKHCFSVRGVTPTQTSPGIDLFPTLEEFTGMDELDLPTVLLRQRCGFPSTAIRLSHQILRLCKLNHMCQMQH